MTVVQAATLTPPEWYKPGCSFSELIFRDLFDLATHVRKCVQSYIFGVSSAVVIDICP